MRRVVLESPFAGDVEGNVTYAKQCVHDCLLRNEAPIASHLLFTQPGVLQDNVLAERALGIEAGLAWHEVADAVVVYTDKGVSKGTKDAIERAEQIGTPIEYRCLHASS